MKNFVQPGDSVTITMPYAVNSGDGVHVVSLFGVAVATYASGATGVMRREGIVTGLAKATGAGENWVVGARLFWSTGNKNISTVSTGNIPAGIALEVVATGVAVGGAMDLRTVGIVGT